MKLLLSLSHVAFLFILLARIDVVKAQEVECPPTPAPLEPWCESCCAAAAVGTVSAGAAAAASALAVASASASAFAVAVGLAISHATAAAGAWGRAKAASDGFAAALAECAFYQRDDRFLTNPNSSGVVLFDCCEGDKAANYSSLNIASDPCVCCGLAAGVAVVVESRAAAFAVALAVASAEAAAGAFVAVSAATGTAAAASAAALAQAQATAAASVECCAGDTCCEADAVAGVEALALAAHTEVEVVVEAVAAKRSQVDVFSQLFGELDVAVDAHGGTAGLAAGVAELCCNGGDITLPFITLRNSTTNETEEVPILHPQGCGVGIALRVQLWAKAATDAKAKAVAFAPALALEAESVATTSTAAAGAWALAAVSIEASAGAAVLCCDEG